MVGFAHRDNQLCVDGIPLADIANEFGTPLYVYSAAAIKASYEKFENSISGLNGQIYFAAKANSNLAVLRLLAKLGAGCDIVSGGEMERAITAGIPADKIIFSGVGKTEQEILMALERGIGQINAESSAEVDVILRIAQETNLSCRLALRVNPDVSTDTHAKIATGSKSTKFGISAEEALPLYRRIAASGIVEMGGFAVHIGSQIMSFESFATAWQHLLSMAEQLRGEGLQVPVLDLGGGIGIDYKTGIAANVDAFGALVKQVFMSYDYKLGFEPGRFITAEAGCLISRVIYTKDADGRQIIVTDGAMNDFIRPTLYDAYHRIEPVNPIILRDTPVIESDVVGPICETGDYFAKMRQLPHMAGGDLLAIMSAGAYGAVMRSAYNTRPPAPEVLVIEGNAYLVSTRQTIQDLMALDHIPEILA